MTDVEEQTGLITSSLICVGCRYELAGLRRDGVCPECGASVESSIRRRRLRTSDAAFARRIETGVRMLLFSSVFFCAFIIAVTIFAMSDASFLAFVLVGPLIVVAIFPASFCWIVGWWLLASEDRTFPATKSWTCRLLKGCCGVQTAGFTTCVVAIIGITSGSSDFVYVLYGAAMPMVAFSAMCAVTGMARFKQIVRLLDSPIGKAVSSMCTVLFIILGGIVIGGVLYALVPKFGSSIFVVFLGLLAIANLLWPFLVFSLWRAIRAEFLDKRVGA